MDGAADILIAFVFAGVMVVLVMALFTIFGLAVDKLMTSITNPKSQTRPMSKNRPASRCECAYRLRSWNPTTWHCGSCGREHPGIQ